MKMKNTPSKFPKENNYVLFPFYHFNIHNVVFYVIKYVYYCLGTRKFTRITKRSFFSDLCDLNQTRSQPIISGYRRLLAAWAENNYLKVRLNFLEILD